MNLIELNQALKQLRLGGMAAVLETRLHQAQAEAMAPIDLISCLVSDELILRGDRLLERRRKQAGFRDPLKTLDNFDFSFNKKMNRSLLFELASGNFVNRREDALFLGPPGSGKSHVAQAIGQPSFDKVIACSIGRHTRCWMNLLKLILMVHAKSSSKLPSAGPCSSLMIWGCVNCP